MAEDQAPAADTPQPPAPEDAAPVGVISTEEVLAFGGTRAGTAASERARSGEPLQSGHKGKAIVRTRHPVDLFEHGVEGVAPITGEGVEVGPSKVDALLAAARSAAVELEVVA